MLKLIIKLKIDLKMLQIKYFILAVLLCLTAFDISDMKTMYISSMTETLTLVIRIVPILYI